MRFFISVVSSDQFYDRLFNYKYKFAQFPTLQLLLYHIIIVSFNRDSLTSSSAPAVHFDKCLPCSVLLKAFEFAQK